MSREVFFVIVIFVIVCFFVDGFTKITSSTRWNQKLQQDYFAHASNYYDDDGPLSLEERAKRYTILTTLFPTTDDGDGYIECQWMGFGHLPTTKPNSYHPCLLLTTEDAKKKSMAVLPLPLSEPNAICLFDDDNKRSSKSRLLSKMLWLTNRDGALYDNLPWSRWTIDPSKTDTVDAAGNPLSEKFHLGKRIAYQRLFGRDWYHTTFAKDKTNSNPKSSLTRRIMELAIREARMELAYAEQQYAIANTTSTATNQQDNDDLGLQETKRMVEQAQEILQKQINDYSNKFGPIQEKSRSTTPYLGAPGGNNKRVGKSYKTPFHLLLEIIQEQLNADVIVSVLENVSYSSSKVEFKGAILLQRRGRIMTIQGERIEMKDDDYGNVNITQGTFMIINCDEDEAVGMARASNIPIHISQSLYSELQMPISATTKNQPSNNDIQLCQRSDGVPSIGTRLVIPSSSSTRPSSSFSSLSKSKNYTSSVFSTDNPIRSLQQYDDLTNLEKLNYYQFLKAPNDNNQPIPRPREIQNKNPVNGMNPLDNLLLPYIDERVRRDYFMRRALMLNQTDEYIELEKGKSKRQRVLENSDDEYASFLESLRADVTQDETGAYSKDLDKDEWYERDRLARVNQLKAKNRKMFGTLLDGIE